MTINEGIDVLINKFGLVEAERFIALLQREPFDYTKWRKNLFKNESIEEISNNARQFVKERYQE
ncbi:MAG: hypothetical protein LBN20_04755 [Endomicrobium sp.]|nr:hypothetical protein [Endomicrobium sp.]